MTKLKTGRNEPCPCGSGKKYKKCCLDKGDLTQFHFTAIDRDIIQSAFFTGYQAAEDNHSIHACKEWVNVWEIIKKNKPLWVDDISELDERHSFSQLFFNWVSDFETELQNAGRENPAWWEYLIQYCSEFCQLFPKSNRSHIENFKRTKAETYFALGQVENGESCFMQITKEHPDATWVYIGWADVYSLFRSETTPFNYEKAKMLYNKALSLDVDEQETIQERLIDLEKEKEKLCH
jgi:tetratricopeptide (TPR) repeat protein